MPLLLGGERRVDFGLLEKSVVESARTGMASGAGESGKDEAERMKDDGRTRNEKAMGLGRGAVVSE